MARRIAVYACAPNQPIIVCRDARLRGEDPPDDELTGHQPVVYGQAGWEWGINYPTFHELVLALTDGKTKPPPNTCGNWVWDCDPPGPGEISPLAVMAHGEPGVLDLDGNSPSWWSDAGAVPGLRIETIRSFHADFALLDKALAEDGVLYFMSCRAGRRLLGRELMISISKLLPGREIVSFRTIGYAAAGVGRLGGQKRPAGKDEPGMRDTPFRESALNVTKEEERMGPIWHDLDRMPWASMVSPHALVVKDGVVLKRGIVPGEVDDDEEPYDD